MKRFPGLISLAIFICMMYDTSGQGSGWDGIFSGNLVGVEATLSGQTSGDVWTAVIDAGGYRFNLRGNADDNICSGTISDPQTQASIPFNASLEDLQLTISFYDINPLTELEEQMSFVFIKNSVIQAEDQSNQMQTSTSTPSGEKIQIDPYLVGNWRRTESYVSGDFSFATDWHMQINGDGTFQYGEGRTIGGGPSSSIDSGTGNIETGKWKTENKIIYLHDGNEWQAYARYYQENGTLMFTFDSGKKQIWEKL